MEPWNLEPAHDTGLSPTERFRSVRRESGLLESLAHHACFSLLRSYFAIAHRLTIVGRENLPAHGPFVLAANHCSHLDALALGAALTPRHRERAFIIFPEGGRSRTGSMMPFKHGLGMLVAETNVPVVPCGLIGTFDALPAERNFPRPGAIKLAIGDPLQFASTVNDRAGWSQIARTVESSVRNL